MTKSIEREVGELTERVSAMAQFQDETRDEVREQRAEIRELKNKIDALTHLMNARASSAAFVVSVVSGISAGIGAGIFKVLQALRIVE